MIQQVTIRNFRALKEVSVELRPLTVLVGPNDSGKSSFLQAIHRGLSRAYEQEDLWRKVDKPKVKVTTPSPAPLGIEMFQLPAEGVPMVSPGATDQGSPGAPRLLENGANLAAVLDHLLRKDRRRFDKIQAALREMVLPGVVAVATPIIVGLLLGYEAVAGMLMVGTIAGVLLATVLNNGGGAWDNAKKYIESGQLKDDQGNVLGKKTLAHAAAVVGDTVGDPFKDTAGPSLHVLVKLLATITLVLAPLFIR